MITLSSPPPSSPPPDQIGPFFNLLNLIGDPAAAKKRMADIYDAALAANEQIAAAKAAHEELAAARTAHDKRLNRERADHDTALKSERAAHEHECGKGMDEVRRAKSEADRLNAQARADAQAAAELRADLDQRLAKLKAAVA